MHLVLSGKVLKIHIDIDQVKACLPEGETSIYDENKSMRGPESAWEIISTSSERFNSVFICLQTVEQAAGTGTFAHIETYFSGPK